MARNYDIKWYGEKVFTEATDENVKAMSKAAIYLTNDVKNNFILQGSYREYGKGHYSSAPGEPPAIDTGTLRASIIHDVSRSSKEVTGRVGVDEDYVAAHAGAGTDVRYGLYLELGTANMAARPFLRPALIRCQRVVEDIFRKANGR